MLNTRSSWMTRINSILQSLCRCFKPLCHSLLASAQPLLLLRSIRSLAQSAAIGTLASATILNVHINRCIESAVSAEELTRQRTEKTVMASSSIDSVQLRRDLCVSPARLREPRSLACKGGLKRKAVDYPDSPSFHRGFTWSDFHPTISLSPATAATKFADPLPSPPEALLNNHEIQHTLWYLEPYIEIPTPFNIDRFENLLLDHPNQPFIASVMRGLREGFWPFDKGEWDLDEKDFLCNYSSKELDLEAIHTFHDREVNLE
jgi:hypothetical protein